MLQNHVSEVEIASKFLLGWGRGRTSAQKAAAATTPSTAASSNDPNIPSYDSNGTAGSADRTGIGKSAGKGNKGFVVVEDKFIRFLSKSHRKWQIFLQKSQNFCQN